MATSNDLMRQAVDSLSKTDGLIMNSASLVEDALYITYIISHYRTLIKRSRKIPTKESR